MVYDLFAAREFLKDGILLAYVGVVVFGMGRLLRPFGSRNDNALAHDEKQPEEIILSIIREKGQAKRVDLMPVIFQNWKEMSLRLRNLKRNLRNMPRL